MNFKEWYNNRAETYENIDRQGLLRYKIALKGTPIKNNMTVVDIGCKTLNLLNLLEKENIKCNYYGIDISEVAIEKSVLKTNQNPQIIIKDVMNGIPLKNNYADRIYCLEVIEHVHTPIFLLEEINRVLKKDGVAVVSCPNPYYWVNIQNSIFRKKENEGHISSFRWQEMQTLCDFVGLKISKTKKTFMTFPPMKFNYHIYIKAIIPLFSESIQYTLRK